MDERPTDTSIYLTKRARLLLEEGGGECPTAVVATFNKNLEALGFTLSRAVFERLRTHPVERVARLYGEIAPVLEGTVGAHRAFRPMYPDFPAQVMAASGPGTLRQRPGPLLGQLRVRRDGPAGLRHPAELPQVRA